MKKPDWNRPRTQKLYLHAPYAERVLMQWPDFKITNYPFSDNGKHVDQESTGIAVIHPALDQQNTTFAPVGMGAPVFKAQNNIGVDISMEAFASTDRNPTVYMKIELYNPGTEAVQDSFYIMARNGFDRNISNTTAEGYCSHHPNIGTWYFLERNWEFDGSVATNGTDSFKVQGAENLALSWVENDYLSDDFAPDRCVEARFCLKPGERACVEVALRCGAPVAAFDYAAELVKTEKFWADIFSDVHTVPDTDDITYQTAFYSMVRQSLQMMARYIEHEALVAPRQGDCGCWIWPAEAIFYLHFLDRIGLSAYTKDAYKFFILRFFRDGGEDDGQIWSNHQQWGNLNGAVLKGICGHLLYTKSEEDFAYYRPYLNRILAWIERQRKISYEVPECEYKGLFSARKGSDWNGVAQYWMSTDSVNVQGIGYMLKAYQLFGAEEAAYVERVYQNYFSTIRNILEDFYKGYEAAEAFFPPHSLGGHEAVHPFMSLGVTKFFDTGIISPHEKMFEQIENWLVKKGYHKNGLKFRMTCTSGGDKGIYAEVYYTTIAETIWLDMYLARGEREKADEVMAAIMQYNLTREFVASERYSPYDEWFSPWQPNGSGSGRLGMAFLNYFGEKKIK